MTFSADEPSRVAIDLCSWTSQTLIVSFDNSAASRETSWESASLMTSDECVNVATDMLVATLYNFIMQLLGTATTEKSLASAILLPSQLGTANGVPLMASQNLMSFCVKEASWELSGENLTEQSQFGWPSVATSGSQCAGPPRSQQAVLVISLHCLLYKNCCVGTKTSAE